MNKKFLISKINQIKIKSVMKRLINGNVVIFKMIYFTNIIIKII